MVNGEKRYDSERICSKDGSDLHDRDPLAESRPCAGRVHAGSDGAVDHLAYPGRGAADEDAEVGAEAGRGKEDCEEAGKIVTVALSQGQVAIIDRADAERVLAHKWYASWCERGCCWYAVRKIHSDQTVLLHRFITGAPDGADVDHANKDTLDNRRANLRVATRAQNMWNRGRTRANRSGFKGVHWDRREKKFRAGIRCNGAYRSLGYFYSAYDAARAYDKAARRLHGEFARLNFTESQ